VVTTALARTVAIMCFMIAEARALFGA